MNSIAHHTLNVKLRVCKLEYPCILINLRLTKEKRGLNPLAVNRGLHGQGVFFAGLIAVFNNREIFIGRKADASVLEQRNAIDRGAHGQIHGIIDADDLANTGIIQNEKLHSGYLLHLMTYYTMPHVKK